MNMIELRTWQMDDIPVLQELCYEIYPIHQKIWKTMYPDHFLHMTSLLHLYQHANSAKFYYRAIIMNQQVCGFVQCEKKTNSSAELGYWILHAYRKQGIMSSIMELLCYDIYRKLRVMSIYAHVDENNTVSRHLLESHGFQLMEQQPCMTYIRYR